MKRAASLVALTALAALAGALMLGERRRDSIERSTITHDSVVMLGDSITAGGDWSTLLPGTEIVNEGHPGFTTAQLIDVARRVAASSPAIVFVLTGTNDVRDGLPPEVTIAGFSEILDEFTRRSPGTRVVVQTITPRAETAEAIFATNHAIVELAEARGREVLDLHTRFDDGTGGLRPSETTDGWHLSPEGYRRWADVLRPVIAGNG